MSNLLPLWPFLLELSLDKVCDNFRVLSIAANLGHKSWPPTDLVQELLFPFIAIFFIGTHLELIMQNFYVKVFKVLLHFLTCLTRLLQSLSYLM